jgi:nucleotide-binding universal stress UspA family protein/predicted GNAT family acetyltransferase
VIPPDGPERPVGVGRIVQEDGDPSAADLAVTVVDDWQGRGVGSALLSTLVDRAREEGVARFEAPVLATNNEAIRMLERLGESTKSRSGREVELTIELPDAPAGRRWRRLLRAFATGALEPGRTVLERLRPRRAGQPSDPRRNVIVVGTDGSEDAARAVETASALALASGARVEIVGVHARLGADTKEIATTVASTAGDLRRRGVNTAEHVRRGDPALVLTDLADELSARLIVVGASRRSKAARRLVGSVSDTVAERAPCDVLIVRTPRTPADY